MLQKIILSLLSTVLTTKEYTRHPVNRGEAVARNTGVSNARADFIAFLDDGADFDRRRLASPGAPATIAACLGLSSLSTTQKYTHVTMVDVINNYDKAHPRA